LIEVRPLFAIDLDANEVCIEELADFRVLEALVLHDVAPVARRVADAEEDGPVEFLGLAERLFAPRMPVHWIVGVLLEVRTCFVNQGICESHGTLMMVRLGSPYIMIALNPP